LNIFGELWCIPHTHLKNSADKSIMFTVNASLKKIVYLSSGRRKHDTLIMIYPNTETYFIHNGRDDLGRNQNLGNGQICENNLKTLKLV